MANHENNCVCLVGGCEAPGLGQSVDRPGSFVCAKGLIL